MPKAMQTRPASGGALVSQGGASQGNARRIAYLWLPRLPSDMALRRAGGLGGGLGGELGQDAPFAVLGTERNALRVHCLNRAAQAAGVRRGMAATDARAIRPDLRTVESDPRAEAAFLGRLRRWAGRYSPLAGEDGADGLTLDITGCAHLFGGEAALLGDVSARLFRAGMTVRCPSRTRKAPLGLWRGMGRGLRKGALAGMRGPSRRPALGLAALGAAPLAALRLGRRDGGRPSAARPQHGQRARGPAPRAAGPPFRNRTAAFAVSTKRWAPFLNRSRPPRLRRITRCASRCRSRLGNLASMTAALDRLLERLEARLARDDMGARALRLTAQRMDRSAAEAEVLLARPMRAAARIARLFERKLAEMDAGYGVERLRLEALAGRARRAPSASCAPNRRAL